MTKEAPRALGARGCSRACARLRTGLTLGAIMVDVPIDRNLARVLRSVAVPDVIDALAEQIQRELATLLDAGRIAPIASRTAPWAELPAELECLETKRDAGPRGVDWHRA